MVYASQNRGVAELEWGDEPDLVRLRPHIRRLRVSRFRNFEALDLSTDLLSNSTTDAISVASHILLTGANGRGKTNVLEALSLLAPGRGLRGARAEELLLSDSPLSLDNGERGGSGGSGGLAWMVSLQLGGLAGGAGDGCRVGISADIESGRKLVKINGVTAKRQEDLGDHVKVAWVTPDMQRIFSDGPSARRRLIDKFTSDFDVSHRFRCIRYDNLVRQRFKLLREGGDSLWLGALEVQMAEIGVAIVAARQDLLWRLNSMCECGDERFPYARLLLLGSLEEWVASDSAVVAEEKMQAHLCHMRSQDGFRGLSSVGPNCSEVAVFLHHHCQADKNGLVARQCSSGEQRALLLSLILAQARLIYAECGMPPILLLDEVVAHLDSAYRQVLLDIIKDYPAQCWMTATDCDNYRGFCGDLKNITLAP